MPPEIKLNENFQVKGFDLNLYSIPPMMAPRSPCSLAFITMRKDFVHNGNTPCLMYGYGGFSISLTPYFSPVHTLFVQVIASFQ